MGDIALKSDSSTVIYGISFSGILNGNGYTITTEATLFDKTGNGAEIRNLNIANSSAYGSLLVTDAYGDLTLDNISVTASDIHYHKSSDILESYGDGYSCGLIFAHSGGTLTANNIYFGDDVNIGGQKTHYAGTIVGYTENSELNFSNIEVHSNIAVSYDAHSGGSTGGYVYAGGLVGYAHNIYNNSTINNVLINASFTSPSLTIAEAAEIFAGGVFGRLYVDSAFDSSGLFSDIYVSADTDFSGNPEGGTAEFDVFRSPTNNWGENYINISVDNLVYNSDKNTSADAQYTGLNTAEFEALVAQKDFYSSNPSGSTGGSGDSGSTGGSGDSGSTGGTGDSGSTGGTGGTGGTTGSGGTGGAGGTGNTGGITYPVTGGDGTTGLYSQTVTIHVSEGETLESVMEKINNCGLPIHAQLVTVSDGTQRLQLVHNYYGSEYTISVEPGDTNFTSVVGFTQSISSGVSSSGTNSTLTGAVTGLNTSNTGYTNGSFVISTNILSADGKTASSQMASVAIAVNSSMSLQDVIDKINSATYKDKNGNDVNLGLRASLTSDGRLQISQVNAGEGFDIKVEAGDTNFTQEVGFTRTVSVGTSSGATSTYVVGSKVYNGTFSEGSFKVTTNKLGADGNASSEMISVNVQIEAGKTLQQSLASINAQLASIGLSASIIADGSNAGKIKIEQTNAGFDFDIVIEAGSTDFTDKVGLTTQVSSAVSNDGTFAYVQGKNDLSGITGYTEGDFVVITNKTDAEGNPLSEMQSLTVNLNAGLTAQQAVDSINSQLAAIGLSASIQDGKIKISQTNAGAGFDIKIEAGSTDFTEKAGLTKSVSVGTSTEGTAAKLVGTASVSASDNGFTAGGFTITTGKVGQGQTITVDVAATDTLQDVLDKINDSGADIKAYIDDSGKFTIEQNNSGPDYFISVEAGDTDFTQYVGITGNVAAGVSNEAQSATLTGTVSGLNTGMTFSGGSFIITTNDVTHNAQDGYFADPSNLLSVTINVSSGESLQSVINKINQQGASIGISASLTDDGKIQLSQLNAGAGFTISVTAGDTDFTEKVGLTSTVSAGVSTPGSSASITGTTTISGSDRAGTDFTEGTFTITSGNAGSEQTAEIEINAGDTINNIISKINSSGIGVTASINTSGKLVISSDTTGADIRLKVQSGSSDFLYYAGLANDVVNTGILTGGTDESQFTTLAGTEFLPLDTAITEGSFKINGVNIEFADGDTLQDAVDKINSYTSQTGVIAELIKNDATGEYKVMLRAEKTGSDYSIYVEGGTSNFGTVTGLTIQSVGGGAALGQSGVKHTVTGSKDVVTEEDAAAHGNTVTQVTAGTLNINGVNVTLNAGTIDNVLEQINSKSGQTGVTAQIKDNKVVFMSDNAFSITEGTSNFVEVTGTAGYTVDAVNTSSRGDTTTGTSLDRISAAEAENMGYTAVSTASELENALRSNQNIVLMNNISLSGRSLSVGGYSGVLNGNGFTISNFSDTGSLIDSTGDGAVIKNLRIEGFNINNSSGYAALLVGEAQGSITFENIVVSNSTINSASANVGALVGFASGGGALSFDNIKIDSDVTVKGTNNVGALVGYTQNNGKYSVIVQNVESSATISGSNYLGGLFGYVMSLGTSSHNFVFDNVKSDGSIESSSTSGSTYLGGFVGYGGGAYTFIDSYASVDIPTDYMLESSSGIIAGYYNTAYTNQFIGGIANASSNATYTNSFYDSSKSDGYSEGGSAASSSTISSYKAFDEDWAAYKIALSESEAIAAGYTVIHSASEFVSKISANPAGKFMLVDDIDFSGVSFSGISVFTGTLDGNGYAIKNLSANSGLFIRTDSGAEIRNLTLDNFDISSSDAVGALVSTVYGDTSIENVFLRNSSIVSTGGSAGGIAGTFISNTAALNIDNIYVASDVTVQGYSNAGGVIGIAQYSSYSSDCTSTVIINDVEAYANVKHTFISTDWLYAAGGVAGTSSVNTFINNVLTGGTVSGFYTGGVLGAHFRSTNSTAAKGGVVVSNAYSFSKLESQGGSFSPGAIVASSGVDVLNSYYYDNSYSNTHGGQYSADFKSMIDDIEFYSAQYYTYIDARPSMPSSSSGGVAHPSNLLNRGTTIRINDTDVKLTSGDTIQQVVNKINEANAGVTAQIVDGRLQISSDEKFQISSYDGIGITTPIQIPQSEFAEGMGLITGGYGAELKISSYSGMTTDTRLSGLISGSITLKSISGTSKSVTISSSDTIGDIIDKINNTSTFRAYLDTNGSLVVEDLEPFYFTNGTSMPVPHTFTITATDTNLLDLTGLKSTSTNFADSSTKATYNILKGISSVTGNETLDAGTFTLHLGSASQNFTVNQGETIDSVLAKINASSIGISAFIENNRIVLMTDTQTPDNIELEEVSGNFGTISGLTTISSIGGGSEIGHEGAYTTLTGKNNVSGPMTKEEAEALGYVTVSTAQELKTALTNSTAGTTIVLMNDIDLSSGFSSISAFNGGTIDGNGFTLKNFSGSSGLIKTAFGDVTIKNLNVDNFDISGSNANIGIFVAKANNGIYIDSVQVSNSNIKGTGNSYVGGLVGVAGGDTFKVSNVSIDENTVITSGGNTAGGLAASINGILSVNDVYIAADISGQTVSGGLTGSFGGIINPVISNVFIDGSINITSSTGYSGGIIGRVSNTSLDLNLSDIVINADFLYQGNAVPTSGSFNINAVTNIDSTVGSIDDSLDGWGLGIGGSAGTKEYEISVFVNMDKIGSSKIGANKLYVSVGNEEISSKFDKGTFATNKYTQVSAGTIKINGQTVTLSGGNIGTAINEINKQSARTGVTASVEDGKLVFKNTSYGNQSISITEGTSDFVKVTGTAGYTIAAPTTSVSGGKVEGGVSTSSTKYTKAEAEAMGYTAVSTVTELKNALSASGCKKIMLMNNINASSLTSSASSFYGIIDGNGYAITNLKQALIGSTSTTGPTIIRNLGISGANIQKYDESYINGNSSTGGNYVGILVNTARGSVTFENISIANSTVTGMIGVGSLVGYASNNSVLVADGINIGSNVNVKGWDTVGGLFGRIGKGGNIVVKNSTVTSNVTLNKEDKTGGGVIGVNFSSDILFENVISNGTITFGSTTKATVGGFIGHLANDQLSENNPNYNIIFKDTYAAVKMTSRDGAVSGGGNTADEDQNQYIGTYTEQAQVSFDNAKYYKATGYGGSLGEQGTATTSSSAVNSYTGVKGALSSGKTAIITEADAIKQGYTVIHNASEFMSKINADKDGKFILMGDIDLSTISYTPISSFSGTLDGNGYTIKNLSRHLTADNQKNGLFEMTTDGAVIKNLTIDNFDLSVGSKSVVGALIGTVFGDTTISNVTVKNSNISGYEAGGLIGIQHRNHDSSLDINNVTIESSVTVEGADSHAAGIIASIGTGNSTGGDYDLITLIRNSSSNAQVQMNAGCAGQIIGWADGTSTALITNVQVGGSVTGNAAMGSVVGASGDNLDINSAFITTDLNPSASASAFGIIAATFNGKIYNSFYQTSDITKMWNWPEVDTDRILNTKGYSSSAYNTNVTNKGYVTSRPVYSQVSAGTIFLNGISVTLSSGSIQNAIAKINENSGNTGVKAYINDNDYVVFEAVDPSSAGGVTVKEGTSNFYDLTVSTSSTSVTDGVTTTTGSVAGLTMDTTFDDLSTSGTFTVGGHTINYTADMTVGDIIDAINTKADSATILPGGGMLVANGKIDPPKFVAGLDEQGRFFIKDATMSVTSGNLGKLLGLQSNTVSNGAVHETGYEEKYSTLTGTNPVTKNDDVSSGDFYINYNGSSQKITVGNNETIQSVMDKINASGLGVTASIKDGKVVITANEANDQRIFITDGTSDFSEIAGFTFGGGQANSTAQGSSAVYMSSNTALSAQGLYTDGNFYVHLTDSDGNITDTAEIEINSSDSIQNIIEKINNSGLGVTAYIDETTGRLAIRRDSSEEAGGVLVTKGTSDFTNKIGFTAGGEQIVAADAGASAVLISQNSALNAHFSSGDFIIQITNKNGAVVSSHTFNVSQGDSAQKVAQMISDAGIGLNAYIDNASGKMVIERDPDSGEGGFIVQKGTSDFTSVLKFTSGGYETGIKEDGVTATITSLYNVALAGNFTAGTFYIDGTEITITEDDIKSASRIETILDRITALTDVIATLDSQNRIVLTKKASAGEGEIEIVKGTSDFTSKFGFTTGGHQNAAVVTGTVATLTSGVTSYNTKVSAGDFYLQLTGDNASDPVRITIDDGDTVGVIIDKINAANMGVTASWDSARNKIVISRDVDKGVGGINIIKGSSDFTNVFGFTSGGQQDPTTVNGVTASITSSNQVSADTSVSEGNFIIRFNGNDHTIDVSAGDTVQSVIDKINQIDGLTAVYNDSTRKITITRDGDSGEGNFEIIKGTSNFTTVVGFSSGGSQSATVIRGSNSSITSTNYVNNYDTFTQGDFTINLTGENAASINITIDADDTVSSIVNKINTLDAGVTARYDNSTGLITISRDADTGDGAIEIVKGSSNFTNIVGFTAGGSSNAVFDDGEYAEITAAKSAASDQHFGAGDFTIKLTGDNAASYKIDVTANDTIQSIINKINNLDAGITAFLNDNNKLVLKRDADSGKGGIEVIKGSSSFTHDIGLTTGGAENAGILNLGGTSKLISTQNVSTAEGRYTTGNFFIQLVDTNGNADPNGLIKVDINQTGSSIDDINTIINNINSQNAGVTASIENGKFVLTRDEGLAPGSFVVLKGTSDFTNVIGLTTGGTLESGVYEQGDAATHTILTSHDLGKKLVSDSMTLGSLGVKNGTFKINGVDINVKASDTIYDLAARINSVFADPKYADIAVSASYENGELVIRSKEASSTANVVVERGTTNFTDIAQLTNDYQNSADLGIVNSGHNAHFTLNGKEYDMALDLNDITDDNVYNGNNLIYLDEDGNLITDAENASITIEVKQTGSTTIDIGRNLLNDSVEKLQSFVNRFNNAMNAAANPIMSDDAEFNTFINKIKSALTNNIGSMNKITQKLADIGIIVKITGGSNSNMGTVEMSLSKTNGQYDYVEAFYKDPQKVFDLLIGNDSSPLDYSVAGSFTRLSDTLHYALENNRGGYFKVTPRSLDAQQKALKREITKSTFDLNELKNTAAGDNGMQGLNEYLLQLEQQYQLINDAILALNNQYSSSITRLILNQNNASFRPIVS